MSFALKDYQRRALIAWRDFTERCGGGQSAADAFAAVTASTWRRPQPYLTAPVLPRTPTACIRIPTGGGKTLVAALACGLAADSGLLPRRGTCVTVVWLVPSTAIADQTLAALTAPDSPVRRCLVEGNEGFPGLGAVQVVDADGALGLGAAAYASNSVVIVTTIQNFRVDDTDQRAVYRQNGQLQSHDAIDPRLAGILARMRPLVIVDEAHNARTDRSFEALARLDPGLVLEITATPTAAGGVKLPSNVLISVSAAELHAEEMVKLPLELAVNPAPEHCLAAALRQRAALEAAALDEHRAGADWLRPLLLIQAQARRADGGSLTPDEVKRQLVEDHGVSAEAIRIATGSVRELDDLQRSYPRGLADPACPVSVVITIEALREGWDCPSAYVLCTLRGSFTDTAAAQIVGRILRQPGAKRRATPALNRAYAFASSDSFAGTLANLRDALVQTLGFAAEEARQITVPGAEPFQASATLPLPQPVAWPADAAIDATRFAALPDTVRQKFTIDATGRPTMAVAWLDASERAAFTACLPDPALAAAVEHGLREALGAAEPAALTRPILCAVCPAERGVAFQVPQLMIRQGTLWDLVAEHHLHGDWSLPDASADIGPSVYVPGRPHFDRGELIVTDAGRVVSRLSTSQTIFDQATMPVEAGTLAWFLERRIAASDVHPDDLRRWLLAAIRHLNEVRGYTFDQLDMDRWNLALALRHRVEEARTIALRHAAQTLLFDAAEVRPTDSLRDFRFSLTDYPAADFERNTLFQHHYYHQVGACDGPEELGCAVALDQLDGVVLTWVRNLVHPLHGFRLPRAPLRGNRWFYPDFVALLRDGRVLVVEYKGADREDSQDTRDKVATGGLWERVTGGIFVLVTDRDYEAIARAIASRPVIPGVHPAWPADYWQDAERLRRDLDLGGDIPPMPFTTKPTAPADLDPPA